jgi:hypothetical protein
MSGKYQYEVNGLEVKGWPCVCVQEARLLGRCWGLKTIGVEFEEAELTCWMGKHEQGLTYDKDATQNHNRGVSSLGGRDLISCLAGYRVFE